MGSRALVESDDGASVNPSAPDEWQQWVAATATRNLVLGDPLLDWLALFGAAHGYQRDDELPDYDARTDFTSFLFAQSRRFEVAVAAFLEPRVDVVTIADDSGGLRDLGLAERTFEAMADGAAVIRNGVLRDAEHRTYGSPDLLVRSDVLSSLFPEAIHPSEVHIPAQDLGVAPWHYRVVDVKFTTLHLTAGGDLANDGSCPAYKAQLHVYNRALGRLQGLTPPLAYVLGRGWEQTVKGVKSRSGNCMERLAPVRQAGTVAGGRAIADVVQAACDWIRHLRREGADWNVLPQPSRPELYPNTANPQDGPWHAAKRRIAEELEDLTLLWQVGVSGRKTAHESGIYRWRDPRCTPATVGVTGPKNPLVLQEMLDVNRTTDGDCIRPARIRAAEDQWRPEPALEFYVDFETVNNLADDLTRFPERGGQALIFMIGCGHLEQGAWRFECFVADSLDETSEASIINDWLAHMDTVRMRVAPSDDEPRVMHWSPAETTTFETAYNSAQQRHPDQDWPSPNWFDFLGRVIREEPVVLRGAMGFGLKAVARAMHAYGFIETLWGDGPTDGLGAMTGAWWCQDEARRTGVALRTIDLMQEIVQYNEIDCKVMMEAVRHFRCHH